MEPEPEVTQYSQDFKEVTIGNSLKPNETEPELETVDIDDGFRYPSDTIMAILERLREVDESSGYDFFSHIPTLEFAKWMCRFVPHSTVYKQDWM
jgi:hypothetical protein